MDGVKVPNFGVLKADNSTAKLELRAAPCYRETPPPAASHATRGGGSLPT
jgi:hypothetical protein